LSQCTIALVSTAGIARNDDRPFDQEHERCDPWWGDPSFRVIPLGTTEQDVKIYHLHIDPRFGQTDLDVVLPMRRLGELADEGIVGQPAPRHYSTMGYILDPTVLIEETAPAIVDRMRADGVDAAALVPA
jgi:D-proline reductase (dithiol) PrdB